MAKRPGEVDAKQAILLEDDADPRLPSEKKPKNHDDDLVSWVVARTDEWRTHRNTNHEADWDRYERLWRGKWSGSEKMRQSERSKFVSPALSEAVETSASEIEEAVFGRGDFFDFRSEVTDDPEFQKALEHNKSVLKDDLQDSDYVTNVSECILNAGVYGTGIGEIVLEATERREIIPQESVSPDGNVTMEATVIVQDVECACLRAVNPRNFLIDPTARTIKDALGVAVEEYVGLHVIQAGQESGDYKEGKVDPGESEPNLEADPQYDQKTTTGDSAHVVRYYGLVPKKLLFPPEKVENILGEMEESDEQTTEEMVEAIVVIANKGTLLKAVENPYLMKDRPIVAFQWDSVPGRFWGRGVCEKGEMPQRMLDAELRSRMDALAFTGAPMMGMDATRMPRGFKLEVAPGKSVLTNGDPGTAMKPFVFGQLDANTFQQGQMLDQMVQRATGALNMTQMAQQGVGGEARSGAVSMSLAGVVKRSKRTLMRFVDQFFIPSLKKILWRQMQYATPRYVPLNSTFVASSTMGIMQREYEMLSLTQLLQTVPPGTPAHAAILSGVVSNTGLQNRKQIVDLLAQAQQAPATPPVDPMQQQLQQMAMQLQLAEMQNKIEKLKAETVEIQSRAMLNVARAQDIPVDNQLAAQGIAMKGIYNTPQDQMVGEVDRRIEQGNQMIEAMKLREASADRVSNERIVAMQTAADREKANADRLKAMAQVAGAAAQIQTAQLPEEPPVE